MTIEEGHLLDGFNLNELDSVKDWIEKEFLIQEK